MTYSLIWLADVMLSAGLKTAETPGWRTRGHGDVAAIKGVICHHTAGASHGNMSSLNLVINGRPDLAGPLCNLALGRDGTYYVVAAGCAWHAGSGSWNHVATGNTSFIGIEAENTGLASDAWPAVQMEAYQRGVAAILKRINADQSWCCGHKEYAPKRKIDPLFDMDDFRSEVRRFLDPAASSAAQIPHTDAANRPTLRRGSTGASVRIVQAALGITMDGIFSADTEAKIRAYQRQNSLVPDGIIGPRTWKLIAPNPAAGR